MYIILRKDGDDRYVFAYENVKPTESTYPSETFEYIHWDISVSGQPPNIFKTAAQKKRAKGLRPGTTEWDDDQTADDDPFVDERTYAEQRQSAYPLESDPMFIVYQGCLEDGDDPATAKAIWTDVRDSIKTKYPKPE